MTPLMLDACLGYLLWHLVSGNQSNCMLADICSGTLLNPEQHLGVLIGAEYHILP